MKRLVVALLLIASSISPLLGSRTLFAQTGNQWQISYFPNLNWAGASVYIQYANVLNFNWGGAPPVPNVPGQNFTARMDSDTYFYAGLYRFTLVADDEIVLTVGNQTYFSTIDAGQTGKTFVVDVPIIEQGISHVRVDYRQYTGPGYISVSWDYLKGSVPDNQPPVPPSTDLPGSLQSLVTRFGDYTPCIQQNLHQVECFQADGSWSSPNVGSIQMEPKILLWQACAADSEKQEKLYPAQDAQPIKCSKTEAGWFPE
jgi:hypothetical protein